MLPPLEYAVPKDLKSSELNFHSRLWYDVCLGISNFPTNRFSSNFHTLFKHYSRLVSPPLLDCNFHLWTFVFTSVIAAPFKVIYVLYDVIWSSLTKRNILEV